MIESPLLLLAGGFGTRLASVVADVPKPLAPVNGRPFLYYQIKSFRGHQINHFIFLIHHLAGKMRNFIAVEHESGILKDCRVDIVEELVPLGTGGSIKNAVKQLGLKGSFLVSNADTYLSGGVKEVHSTTAPAIATLMVDDVTRYGKVELQADLVQSFVEKGNSTGSGLINSGLYHLHPSVFENIQEDAFSIEQTLFPFLVQSKQLRAVSIDSEFIDIGLPEDYFKFQNRLKNEH
jgi:D-glycero-alpha-D-manno-heptose 1-phosphate guanylyltransferase